MTDVLDVMGEVTRYDDDVGCDVMFITIFAGD